MKTTKIRLINLMALCSLGTVFSQVGIGTSNPQAMLHIENNADQELNGIILPKIEELPTISEKNRISKLGMLVNKQGNIDVESNGLYTWSGNNWIALDSNPWNLTKTSHKANKNIDDMYVMGNIGIGLKDPKEKLEVNGKVKTNQFQITENPKFGAILTSDENGNGTWQDIAIQTININLSKIDSYNHDQAENHSLSVYTGVSFNVPPGKWLLNLSILVNQNSSNIYKTGENFIRFKILSTNPATSLVSTFDTDNTLHPRLASQGITYTSSKGVVNGSLGINNTSTQEKKYYLYVDNQQSKGDGTAFTIHWTYGEQYLSLSKIN